MRDLLSAVLRLAELETPPRPLEIPRELSELVTPCGEGGKPIEYYAVDSGYVVQRVGPRDILIQSIVAVGRDIKRKYIVTTVTGDPHVEARIREIRFAEFINSDIVLVDGPLTPYVNTARIIGVSKDPRLARYGPRIPDADLRDKFTKLSRYVGERGLVEALLARAPSGSYLPPVDLGELAGTFFKSDWVIYVEFPKSYRPEALCQLFRRYPIRLRLAHHLAKVNREYLKTVKIMLSTVLGAPPRFRDFL